MLGGISPLSTCGTSVMKITRILSNNAVMLLSPKNEEFVAVGRGVGFGKKPDDDVNEALIEHLFGKKSEGLGAYFAAILGDIAPSVLMAVQNVVQMAGESLKIAAPETLFLALSDHINAAVLRHQQGKSLRNGLLWETRAFYPQEYAVALQALAILRDALHIDLPDDEAGFISLHLANAVNDSSLQHHMQATEILRDLLNIVRYEMRSAFNENSEVCQRFIIHLRFFIQRMLNNKQHIVGSPDIYADLPTMIPDAWKSARRLRNFIEKNHDYTLNVDEMAFLTLHIHRLKTNQYDDHSHN